MVASRLIRFSTVITLAWTVAAGCSSPTALDVPTPTFTERVIAANGTTLHTIDYGGSGVALVFLSGLGNSAHIYDDFAPRFKDVGHVFAFTRRGYGQSGRPAAGYETASLAKDVLSLLDSLKLQKAILIGHSVAGDELTEVAASAPSRVLGVAYLDAAYDRSGTLARIAEATAANAIPPDAPAPTAADVRSAAALQSYLGRNAGHLVPLAEVKATYRFDGAGQVVASSEAVEAGIGILNGERAPRIAEVASPMLLIYAVERTIAQEFPWIAGLTSNRAAAEAQGQRYLDFQQRFEATQRAVWRSQRPNARIVEIRQGSHYVFFNNASLVETTLREFIASVPK